jgi:hypothetical protein
MKKNIAKLTLHLISIVISTIVLCFMAWYNSYPIVFNNDTGVYIENGFYGIVAPERPITYGLFVFITSLQRSLWIVIFVQSFIVALTLYYFFRHFTKQPRFIPYYLTFMILISFFMGASFDASWLMPDIFTAISLLCIGLLLFVKEFKIRDIIITSILCVISISMHNSHFYICLILIVLFSTGVAFKRIRKMYRCAGISTKKIALVFFLIIFSNLFLGAIHYVYSGSFKSSRGGVFFLMSNLVEMGIVDKYLAENCNNKNYRICMYKDSLPNNFLWADNTPINKTGGWEANEKEYSEIVADIISTPKYAMPLVYKSITYTFKQFFNYDIVDVGKPSVRVNNAIGTNIPGEFQMYTKAKQSKGRLSLGFVNFIQNVIVNSCLFSYLIILLYKRISLKYKVFIFFILAGLFINAWICSTFSGVFPRYQLRVMWLLPLPLFLYITEFSLHQCSIYRRSALKLRNLKTVPCSSFFI